MWDLKIHIDQSLEVSVNIPLRVKCDSKQITSNHGETEDAKQHSSRQRDGKLSLQRDDSLFMLRPNTERAGAFEKTRGEEIEGGKQKERKKKSFTSL